MSPTAGPDWDEALISIAGLRRRFSVVLGEWMSAKTSQSSSQTAVVSFGVRLGVPPEQTVAA